ncbi:transcriptional activator protein acu-15 [Podospora fimiseda]|uniref:Transcriptional activator protein acu-15 n=1 Tax=Podospora fimiseda TaxID=252190 RepID=A0AAN7BIE4_9PEZI|nr:transcriptional activator protein acu-15 [Podospora fimiseda]
MPQSRPNNKRHSDVADMGSDGGSAPKVKLPRIERGPEDFSTVVKHKLQSYTRTGQACDRCKVRKIRCDALPEGCSHCTNGNLDCYVTDRVTGRTERRGYLQQLEREKGAMLAHIRSLEKLLETNGIEVRPWQFPGYNNTYPPGIVLDNMGNPVYDSNNPKDQWRQVEMVWVKGIPGRRPLPSERGTKATHHSMLSRPTDVHLGVSWDKEPLSSIKGTTLSILGTTIDVTSFDAPDMDEPLPGTAPGSPLYNKSVMAFYQSTLGVNPVLSNVELPSRVDAFTYVEWYFLTIHPFLPVLHKPSFLQLLTRMYDDANFKATMPEQVVVHMVFAIIYFQYGVRNREMPERFAQLNDLSNKHYHWSLNKFYDLAISQSVTSAQALAMIIAHTRNFAKPGSSITIATYAFVKAIELNLHRAVKIPGGGTTLENEIRKRVWWAIMAVFVTLNGRLGRPMPISVQDIDTEFPIAIPDEFLGSEGVLDSTKIGHCNYQVGIMAFKATPLFMEMYSKLYSVKRDPSTYMDVVQDLETAMKALLDDLPDELRIDRAKKGAEVFALYTQAFCLEFMLCLRHPSVCMTDDAKFRAENTRICEESARKLLKVVIAVQQLKSLDTTWYQLAVYVGAIFSVLAGHWERRFEATQEEVATLKEEMAQWLGIIAEIGRLIGTSNPLDSEIGGIIERTIGAIEHDMGRKPLASPEVKQQSTSPYQRSSVPLKQGSANPPTPASNGTPAEAQMNGNGYYNTGLPNSATPYPALAYPDQTSAAGTGHQNGTSHFDSADGASYLYAAASAATAASSASPNLDPATNPLVAFASQATQHVAVQSPDDWRPQAAAQAAQAAAAAQMLTHAAHANAWHDWTAAIAAAGAGSNSQERYSANALLTLGGSGRPGDDQGGSGGGADGLGVGAAHAGQWPLLLFNPDNPGIGGAGGGGPGVNGGDGGV